MKKLNIIAILLLMASFSGCADKMPGSDEMSENIVVPNRNYIYLDAGVKTRGTLLEGIVLNDKFGAYGYTYAFNNKWSTYRISAVPNVFDNVPQEVTYANSLFSYAPVKEWEGGKYTFFAYYPYGNANVVPSALTVEGTPYVTYTPDISDVSKHADIMTAKFEDTSLSSSPYVYFDFYHRLSAVDVGVLNFYEYNYTITDDDGNESVKSESITIELTELTLSFENLKYGTAKIYLDKTIPTEATEADVNAASYTIVSSSKEIDPNIDGEMKLITTDGKSMLFIPQDDSNLKVTADIRFKKRRPDGTYLTQIVDNNETVVFTETKATPFSQALKEGSRYYVQLTFTSAAVSINIITSAEWSDKEVDYEFE